MQQIIDTRAAAERPTSASLATRLLRWFLDADRKYRENRALDRLSGEQLDDIGRTRTEIDRMRRASRLG